MTWKKNAISYICWLLYTLIVGAVLLCLADVVCDSLGLVVYWAAILALLYVAVVGGIVFGAHQLYRRLTECFETKVILGAVLEATFVVILLAAGFFLRVQDIDIATDAFGFYEKAQLTYGESIPKSVHGAEYLYLLVLRGLFTVVGNHFAAGVWLQIVLQLLAAFLCFLAIRRLSGTVAALITLGFCMCGPYMVNSGLSLSPEMLFFLMFSIVLLIISMGAEKRLKPVALLPVGVLAAICTYMDIAGVILLFWAFCMIFSYRRELVNGKVCVAAVCCLIFGFVLGFFGCFLGNSMISGKDFGNVLTAWMELYQPGTFEMPYVFGTGAWESYLLAGLMTFGIYSFWCDREKENLSVGTISMCGIIVGICFGIFTPQMPGYFYLYLMMAILAGVSVSGCFKYSTGRAASINSAMEYLESMEAVAVDGSSDAEDADTTGVQETVAEDSLSEKKPETSHSEKKPETEKCAEDFTEQKPKVKLLDNPLPLPKKHEKRVLDYAIGLTQETADFDYDISESDDFDI